MIILWLALSTALAGSTWFYPNHTAERVELTADNRVMGVQVKRTGALLVQLTHPAAREGLQGLGKLVVQPGDGDVIRIIPPDGVDEVALSRTLWASPEVLWAHPDLIYPLVPHGLPDDPYAPDQWHLENVAQWGGLPGADIHAIPAWDHVTGAGALIAIVDSGVDLSHPDLSIIAGYDYVDGDDDPSYDIDYHGAAHGTAAAGLAGAIGGNGLGVTGVAQDADIYAIRLLGGDTSLADTRNVFIEATDAGAWVISNSWGYDNGCASFPTYGAMAAGFHYAETNGRDGLGSVVVFSAGNGNCDITDDGLQAYPTVVSVAAADRYDVKEGYSSFGPWVDITGPSGGVLTTNIVGEGGYGSWAGDEDYTPHFTGTSASAPIVSGVFALILAANPELTAADARQIMCDTAVRIDVDLAEYDEDGWSPYYGCGRADAAAAVASVINTAPTAPSALGPTSDPYVDSVVLTWLPGEDPDGDRLTHTVSWWTDEDSASPHTVDTAADFLDLTGAVEVGQRVSWTVSARDNWSATDAAEGAPFTVLDLPITEPEEPIPPNTGASFVVTKSKEPRGCATAAPAPVPWLWVGLIVLWARRRPAT